MESRGHTWNHFREEHRQVVPGLHRFCYYEIPDYLQAREVVGETGLNLLINNSGVPEPQDLQVLEATLQGEAGGDLSPTASLGFGNLFEKTEADVSDIRVSLGLCSGVYAPGGWRRRRET